MTLYIERSVVFGFWVTFTDLSLNLKHHEESEEHPEFKKMMDAVEKVQKKGEVSADTLINIQKYKILNISFILSERNDRRNNRPGQFFAR